MVLWTWWTSVASAIMLYLASGSIIVETLKLEDAHYFGTAYCVMGFLVLMIFTRMQLADEVG